MRVQDDEEEILEFIEANPVASIATVEGDRTPRTGAARVPGEGRLPAVPISEPKTSTASSPRPEVEACFNDQAPGIQVRVGGKVRFVEDDAVLDDVLVERSFLQSLAEKQGRGAIKLFVIADAMAYPGPGRSTGAH